MKEGEWEMESERRRGRDGEWEMESEGRRVRDGEIGRASCRERV